MIYRLNNSTNYMIPKTSIAIDTNVLIWTFYDNIYYTKTYQKTIYPNYLSKILSNKNNKLYTSIFNIFEMYNIIEENEYNIYLDLNNLNKNSFKKKDFRKINDERIKLRNKLQLIYNQVSSAIEILDYNATNTFLTDYIDNYPIHKYDIFDFSLINCCLENNISCILTDDSDFSNTSYLINQLNIITANKNLN